MAEQVNVIQSQAPDQEKWDFIQVKNLVKYFPVRGGLFQRVVA